MTTGDKRFGVQLVLLPAVIFVGLSISMMLPGPSDAESQPVAARSPVIRSAQNTSWFNPAITPTEANLATPAGETTDPAPPADAAPIVEGHPSMA